MLPRSPLLNSTYLLLKSYFEKCFNIQNTPASNGIGSSHRNTRMRIHCGLIVTDMANVDRYSQEGGQTKSAYIRRAQQQQQQQHLRNATVWRIIHGIISIGRLTLLQQIAIGCAAFERRIQQQITSDDDAAASIWILTARVRNFMYFCPQRYCSE